MSNCGICGEPMPAGEEMFKFHGYSGPCPKPPLAKPAIATTDALTSVVRLADSLRAAQRAYMASRTQDNGAAVGAAAQAYDEARSKLSLA